MTPLPTCQHVEIHNQEAQLVPHCIYHICAVDLFANGKSGLFHTVFQLMCANTSEILYTSVYKVTNASCMGAHLHPSCCARKGDSPQPVTHSEFVWADIQNTTGPQIIIRNEKFYALWLSCHVSKCHQRNELGPTAHLT